VAKSQDTQDQELFQEHQIVKELMAELQAIDDKVRVEVRFYEVMD